MSKLANRLLYFAHIGYLVMYTDPVLGFPADRGLYLWRKAKEKRPQPRSDTLSAAHAQGLPWHRVTFTTWYQAGFYGNNLLNQRLTVVWRQTNVSRPDKTEQIAFFCLLSLLSQFHLWKCQLHNLEHIQTTWKTSKWPRWASRHFDTTGSMSLERNSVLSMRTICFPKPVSELVLQTGVTRPRSWTEEVSDLGKGLFSFAFLHK
jgi:hypothetical protein